MSEDEIFLPEFDTPRSIITAVQQIDSILGLSLYEYFSKKAGALFGANWVKHLDMSSNDPLATAKDFSVLVKSWVFYPQSMLWTYLPNRGNQFKDLSHRCLGHRNVFAHNAADFSAKGVVAAVVDFHELAACIGLDIAEPLKKLRDRIQDLAAGKTIPAGPSIADDKIQSLLEAALRERIAEELRAAEAERERLQAIVDIQGELSKANAAEKDAIALKLADAENELKQHQDELADMRAQIAALAFAGGKLTSQPTIDEASSADTHEIGADWVGPLPSTVWSVMRAVPDLVQPVSAALLSQRIGLEDSQKLWFELNLLQPLVDRVHEDVGGHLIASVGGNLRVVAVIPGSAAERHQKTHEHGRGNRSSGLTAIRPINLGADGTVSGLPAGAAALCDDSLVQPKYGSLLFATSKGCLVAMSDGQFRCVSKFTAVG